MTVRIKPYQEFENNIREIMGDANLLKEQVGGWCSSVVILDYALDHTAFVAWRDASRPGRFSMIKLVGHTGAFLFEHDSDAMAFYLTFGQKLELIDED